MKTATQWVNEAILTKMCKEDGHLIIISKRMLNGLINEARKEAIQESANVLGQPNIPTLWKAQEIVKELQKILR